MGLGQIDQFRQRVRFIRFDGECRLTNAAPIACDPPFVGTVPWAAGRCRRTLRESRFEPDLSMSSMSRTNSIFENAPANGATWLSPARVHSFASFKRQRLVKPHGLR